MPAAYDIAPKLSETRIAITYRGNMIGALGLKELSAANVLELCESRGHKISFSQAAMIVQSILTDHAAGRVTFKGTPLVEDIEFPLESSSSAVVVAMLEDIRAQLDTVAGMHAIAYTKQQVAQAINVCEKTIDRWRTDKKDPLPYVRRGNKILFRREPLIEWLKRHEVPREKIATLPAVTSPATANTKRSRKGM